MAPQWQTQQACFRAKAVKFPTSNAIFSSGETSGDVWIDDVSIVRVDVDKLSAKHCRPAAFRFGANQHVRPRRPRPPYRPRNEPRRHTT